MEEWKKYGHILATISLTALALSLLWLLWPVLAALLIALGVYLIVVALMRVFRVRVDCSTTTQSSDQTK